MSRRERVALGIVLGLALALRLAHVLAQRDDVLFDQPVLDERRYVEAGRALASGQGEGPERVVEREAYWQPPGVIYALAAIFRLAGDGLLPPRLVQVLLSTASCLLLFAVGRRLLGTRVAIAAAAILAVHGVLVFESHELLPPTWMLFFDLLALWLLLIAREAGHPLLAFAGGIALGASAVFSPTILVFVPVAGLWLRRPAMVAALAAGVVLLVAPVTIRNWRRGGELVLVSTNGGMNFYMGNNPDYRQTFAMRPGRHWDELTREPEAEGVTRPGAKSSWFLRRGLAFYRDQPGEALALALRKQYLFFHGAEIPRDTDIYAARASSPVLALLVGPRGLWFPDGLLVPAALLGVALLWSERRRLALILGFAAVQAVIVPAFFVSSRHRVPVLAVFALLAAAGVAAGLRRWPGWSVRKRALVIGSSAVLLVGLNLPTWESGLSLAGEQDFYRGLALRDQQRVPAAIEAFARATRAAPADPRPWLELGNTLAEAGRIAEATGAWARAAELDPWDSRSRRAMAVAFMRQGDIDGAIAALEAHVGAAARPPQHYAPDQLNLASLYARRGDADRVLAALHACRMADAAYFQAKLPGVVDALVQDASLTSPGFWDGLAGLADEVGALASARGARERAAALRGTSPPPPGPVPPARP